jgi:flagellar basal-body rod modification protein FlgD
MSIPGINNTGSIAFGALSQASSVAGENKDQFLKLLMTQLTHQNPLKPQEPGEFITQLTQFTSLEQLEGIRGGLDTMALTQTSATHAQMVQFVGKEIQFLDNGFNWSSDQKSGELNFKLEGKAETGTIMIQDANGKKIRTLELGARASGENKVVFDGLDDNGTPIGNGDYTFTVMARDADEKTVTALTRADGKVVSVTFEKGYPELVLADGRRIGLGKVLKVSNVTAPAVEAPEEPEAIDTKNEEDGGKKKEEQQADQQRNNR